MSAICEWVASGTDEILLLSLFLLSIWEVDFGDTWDSADASWFCVGNPESFLQDSDVHKGLLLNFLKLVVRGPHLVVLSTAPSIMFIPSDAGRLVSEED